MGKSAYNGHNNKEPKSHMNNNIMLANERIRAPQVRLIGNDGTNYGVVNTRDALYQAQKAGLDLVAINEQVSPMVVKILDLNKYVYEQKKAAKERARKSRENEIVTKEIQLRPVTDYHDIEIKAKHAREFLDNNCKVRIVIKFRGREMSFTNRGFEVVNLFLEKVGAYKAERAPMLQGTSIIAIIASDKVQPQAS